MAKKETVKIHWPNHISRTKIEMKANFWNGMLEVWDKCEITPEDDFNTTIFKKYVRIHSVTDIFHELKAHGDDTFKNPTQITNFIRETNIEDKQLEWYVKFIQEKNLELSLTIHS